MRTNDSAVSPILATHRKPNPFEYFMLWAGLMLCTLWFLSYFMVLNFYDVIGFGCIYIGCVIIVDQCIPWGMVPT